MSMTNSDAVGRAHNPQVRAALDTWQRVFLQRDWVALPELVADDVTFHTPGDAVPLRGKEAFVASLRQSFGVFETLKYARDFVGEEGQVPEFRGSVGDAGFTGIDIIRLDGADKVTDLAVMFRPMSAMMTRGQGAAQ